MLINPSANPLRELHDARESLRAHYNQELEKILNENSHIEKYWILGKVRFPEELGGKVGRAFLQACLEKPPIVKEAFLYEVNNKIGCKTLLWVMNPDGSLRLPTINKTIQATPAKKPIKVANGRKKI